MPVPTATPTPMPTPTPSPLWSPRLSGSRTPTILSAGTASTASSQLLHLLITDHQDAHTRIDAIYGPPPAKRDRSRLGELLRAVRRAHIPRAQRREALVQLAAHQYKKELLATSPYERVFNSYGAGATCTALWTSTALQSLYKLKVNLEIVCPGLQLPGAVDVGQSDLDTSVGQLPPPRPPAPPRR